MTTTPVRIRTQSVLRLGTACLAAALVHAAGSTICLAQESKPANSPKTTTEGGGTVKFSADELVTLHVSDENLAQVLEMLSLQSSKNIIAGKDVNARVTANLYNVTFYEALDAILGMHGYGFREEGNFIKIYTMEQLQAIVRQERQRVSKVITLNHLNSTDAAELVKPLLSASAPGQEPGQIKTNGKLGTFPTPGDTPLGGDDYANSSILVIYDYEENVEQIEKLLAQLDTKPAQVLVEATILQTDLNEANALGVDFSVVIDENLIDFVGWGPLNVVNGLIRGTTTPSSTSPLPADGGGTGIQSTVGNTASEGGFKVGVVTDEVSVFLRALDEVTDTTILSNPKLLALNRMPSRVLVGRKVGYLSTTSTDTATTQTVQFLDTGTQLHFRPIVANDGSIRMELRPQVSEAVIREQRDATGAAVTIPDEVTNELTTNVIVRDGQTIVLGGLFRESTQSSRSQVPMLGDIPILGYAFRGQDDEIKRNEIVFMITPHIVNDTAMAEMGQRGKEQVDRAVTGAREGVLFFSRDRMTSQLNVKADEAAAAGDTKLAQWYLRRSLGMNSHQPEAVGMRAKLTGEKANWPDRSMLQRIIDGETNSVIKKVENTKNAEFLASVSNSITPGSGTPQTWIGGALADDSVFSDTPATPTSFARVGMFHQFMNIQRNAYVEQIKADRITNVNESTQGGNVDVSDK